MGGKKEMTWLQLVNMKLKARQAKGEHPSIKDVAVEAKKEWTQIKAGKHPQYVQGKAVFTGKKTGTRKIRKSASTHKSSSPHKSRKSKPQTSTQMVDIAKLEGKMCKKCMKTVKRMSQTMRGGTGLPLPQAATEDDSFSKPSMIRDSTGTINPTIKGGLFQAQCGGKRTKKQKRNKSKKGGCGCGVMGGGSDDKATSPTEIEVQEEEKKDEEDKEKEEEDKEKEEEEQEKEEKEEEKKEEEKETTAASPSTTAEEKTDDEDEDEE